MTLSKVDESGTLAATAAGTSAGPAESSQSPRPRRALGVPAPFSVVAS